MKERELQNLLRWLPGYEASQLNHKTEPPMGFALFSTPPYAIAAKDALQELVFDAECKSILHTEMAKKNLFVKRGVVSDANPVDQSKVDQSKRLRTGGDYTHTGYPNPSPLHPAPLAPLAPLPPVWRHQGYMAPPPLPSQYDPYRAYPAPVPMQVPAYPAPVPMQAPAPLPAPSGYAPVQNSKDNSPCNTLFIGNLGENVIEEELRNLFSVQPGFKQMKLLRQERNTVCFIEFNDMGSATNVHQKLQGAVIPSSGRGGIRIQYSKNPFGRRKDGLNAAGGPEANWA